MLKLSKRKKEKVSEQDAYSALVNDCNRVLGIIRNSITYSSIDTKAIIVKLGLMEGTFYDHMRGEEKANLEKRVLEALRELAKRRVIGFGGNLGDIVIFSKNQLPSVVA
jgi:hypothetical protein